MLYLTEKNVFVARTGSKKQKDPAETDRSATPGDPHLSGDLQPPDGTFSHNTFHIPHSIQMLAIWKACVPNSGESIILSIF